MSWRENLAATLVIVIGVAGTRGENPIPVKTWEFDIAYAVNEDALPLEFVELWYSTDGGNEWARYGRDDDLVSPFTFRAKAEGVHQFFFIMKNHTGVSSPPPSGPVAHVQVLVDVTAPLVEFHPLRFDRIPGETLARVRWAAIDQNLGDRPVAIEYRSSGKSDWKAVSPEPLANSGRFDWRIPAELTGTLDLRIRVRDRVGHEGLSATQTVTVQHLPPEPVIVQHADDPASRAVQARPAAVGSTSPDQSSPPSDAQAMYERGRAYRRAGETDQAIAAMREAVRLDPTLVDAFAEMGQMLYRKNDLDRSLQAYDLAIEHSPNHRSALQGSAKILRRRHDYAGAVARLRRILDLNPDDAEIWVNLGDVAVFQGDEITAREAYRRAIESRLATEEVVRDARKRLDLMSSVSRSYR